MPSRTAERNLIMAAIDLNKELFENYVNDEEKAILVDYWAPWCVYCRRIGPGLNILADEYKDKLVIGKVNIDNDNFNVASHLCNAIWNDPNPDMSDWYDYDYCMGTMDIPICLSKKEDVEHLID